jgi:hypothetical protein
MGGAKHGREQHQTRDAAPEPAGDGWDAASHGLLLRTADVRSVRCESRKNPTNGEPRSLVVADWVASTEDEDSYESVIVADWDQDGRLDRFRANPVLLWMHNRESVQRPAIGLCENVRVENKKLLLTVVCDDTSDFDREISTKIEKGILRAGSVGWAWGEARLRSVGDREVVVFSKNELREFSICNVGANAFALAQRDLVTAAREMARTHGSVGMREVVAHYRERFSRRTSQRATPTTLSLPPAPAPEERTPAPREPRAPGETMKKKLELGAVRATDTGIISDAACPHCEASIEVLASTIPLPTQRAAEVETLTKRATTAEGKIAETQRALDVAQTELDGAKTRLAAMEPELTAARAAAERHQAERIATAVDERVGKKIFPAERANEIKLATLLLADRTPDPDSKDAEGKPTRTLGEKAFAARLAEIDVRPHIGLVGDPITGGDQKHNTGAGKDPAARNLAAEIDDLVAKQPVTLHN